MILNSFKIFKLPVLIIIILLALALVIFRNASRDNINIDLSQASVVKEMQDLNRLETSSFTIEKIVEAGTEGNAFQDLLYGDRILLIAHGRVVAGIDLAGITEENIIVRDKTLTINVAAPIIFSSTLDNTKTRVYDRTQGFLSRGNKDLESKARVAAETSIRQAACDAGILIEAGDNAVERLQQLFQFAGFDEVVVNVPLGDC